MTTLTELIENDRPTISAQSIKTYVSNLKKIGITTVEDLKKLNDTKAIFEEIADLKITMKRNVLSAILVIIKASGEASEEYEKYREHVFDLGVEYSAQLAKNEKTEKQMNNWVSIQALQKITRKHIKNNPGSQNTLISALYTYQPPTRLDYIMEIVRSDKDLDPKKNYLLIKSARNKVFIFRDYKTAKKYGETRIPVSKQLNTVLNKFLKLNPDRKYLLQQKNGEPFTRNQLGKQIPKVFKDTGKNVTLNIIRHVFVSENVDLDAVKKHKQLASQMMHSGALQEEYAKN